MTELPYKKIERIIKYRILRGEYWLGQKLSPIRTIAKEVGYNPATVYHENSMNLLLLKQQLDIS